VQPLQAEAESKMETGTRLPLLAVGFGLQAFSTLYGYLTYLVL